MTVTVFTCMLGRTDPVRKPTVVNPAVRYVCFTNKPLVLKPYIVVHVDLPKAGPRAVELLSRELKILANRPELGEPDVTVWHDAAFRMDCDPMAVATRYLNGHDMLAFAHPHRSSIEAEAVAIARLGYMSKRVLDEQIRTYRDDGFLAQGQITSTGLCFRRNTSRVRTFNAFWWEQVARWGWRDQMSVDYAIWKTGVNARYIPGHYRDNTFAKYHLPTCA